MQNIHAVIYIFGAGFSFVIAANISGLLVVQEVKSAQRRAIVSIVAMFFIGILLSVIMYFLKNEISSLFTNDWLTQLHHEDLLRIYVYMTPFVLVEQVMIGIAKAIGRERVYVCIDICMIFIFQFGCIALMFGNNGLGYELVWYSRFISLLLMIMFGFTVIMYATDWDEKALEVKRTVD